MKEKWKDIPNYEGLYQISDKGRVKNSKNQILKNNKRYDGYIKVNLSKNGKSSCLIIRTISNILSDSQELHT